MANSDQQKQFAQLLEHAALLQKLVPDAVLVGGSAAVFYAQHRLSTDHDHVLADLENRFELILEALEAEPDYLVNRVTPGKIILGQHNGIEYGIRQLIRRRPLEVAEEQLPSGEVVRVPTLAEILRIKAYLIVKRNQTRDYLDVAALAQTIGFEKAADILTGIDDYYSDLNQESDAMCSQVLTMLVDPKPFDDSVIKDLKTYKGLGEQWQSWSYICEVLNEVASHMGNVE